MRTTFIFLLTLVLVTVQGWAAPVKVSQAQMVAQNFANANGNFNASTTRSAMKLAYAEKSDKMKDQPVFYVFNSSDNYVIVAGDDRAEQVLGYGEGQFDVNDIPCGMRDLFNVYKEEIEFLQTHPKLTVERVSQGAPSLMATSVSPLISTNWGQESPYYNQCPKYGSVRCVTGCAATAMAQIMQYWSYPSSAPAMSAYTTSTLNISVPALSSKTLSYNKSNDAIAWLMRYAGQSVSMDYQPASKGGSGASMTAARSAMVNKFDYSTSASQIYKSNYTDTQWKNKLNNELNSKRPVYYQAVDANGNGGHAFIIDGYNTSGKYHINWGWKGSCNGYFTLNSFNTDGLKFNEYQNMIVDLRPSTILSINPNPVAFNNKTVGKTYTAKISIKGYNLTGSLSLKLTGATGVFSIDKTSITKSAGTSGATVTVTYKPTGAGSHSATLTISGGGLVSSKTVKITGNAKVRTISPSTTSISFAKIKTGNSSSKTFTVKGSNLSGPLTLKLSGVNSSMFKINKTSITASQASIGVTITVTYKPTAVGSHSAIVTISGGDAVAKTVTLKGSAIKGSGIVPVISSLEKNPDLSTEGLSVIGGETSTTGNDGSTVITTITDKGGKDNGTSLMAPRNSSAGVDELAADARVYAEGQVIIIESPVEQEAIVSDISGRAQRVNLQTGRNEVPVNASGIYIVRIRDKSTKLMLK